MRKLRDSAIRRTVRQWREVARVEPVEPTPSGWTGRVVKPRIVGKVGATSHKERVGEGEAE
jgi:hypothetical protein